MALITLKADKGKFSYKECDINVDSRLEKAAIIYLKDVFKIEKIERFKNILNFKYENKNHHFNPDFYCKKDEKIFIVEVKMKWTSKSLHPYYSMMPFKKLALSKFCEEKKYEMLWLDFDYDKKLKEIYNNLNTIRVW